MIVKHIISLSITFLISLSSPIFANEDFGEALSDEVLSKRESLTSDLIIQLDTFGVKELPVKREVIEWKSLNLNKVLSELTDEQKNQILTMVSEMDWLERICIHSNGLYSVPNSFGNLRELRVIILSYNNLKVIPEIFKNMGNLREIYLSGNNIKNIPEWLGTLTGITTLFLQNNQIEKVPESLSSLLNLGVLYAHNNQIREVPASLGSLAKLEGLNLNGNKLKSLPTSISKIKTLTYLGLKNNPLVDFTDSQIDWGKRQLLAHFRDRFLDLD